MGMAFFVALNFVEAQENKKQFKAGLKLGANTSQMTGDGYGGFFKFGLVAGVFGKTKLAEKIALQYEIMYQGKGSNKPAEPDKGVYDSYKIRLDYIQVPLMLQYQLDKFEIEAGPAFGYLFNRKEWDQNGVRPEGNFEWRTFELDGIIGVNYYAIPEHLFFNARAHHSITSLVNRRTTTPYGTFGGAWNIVLALSVNYQF